MLQYTVFIGAAVYLIGVFRYIQDTINGKTKPNRVTWLIWTLAPFIGTAAAIVDGVGWAALPVFIVGFGPLLVFIASFANPKAYWKLKNFDYICASLSVLALVFWTITKEPLVAIMFAIASDAFASVPTITKSWKHPDTESGVIYATALFNVFTGFFALEMFSASELAFPIYLILLNSTMIAIVYKNQIRKHIKKS